MAGYTPSPLKKSNPDKMGPGTTGTLRVREAASAATLWDRHHEITRLLLLGTSNVDIAKELGVTKEEVSQVKNSPVVAEKLSLMQAARDIEAMDVAEEISKLAPIAVEKLKAALETGKVNDQQLSASRIIDVAKDIIDRDQGRPTQRIESKNIHGHLSLDDISEIKKRAASMRQATIQMESV